MALDKSDPYPGLPRKLVYRPIRVTKPVTAVTKKPLRVTRPPVTKAKNVTPVTDDRNAPKSAAERMKAYRARKKTTS
jgi:hypothetical protein